MNDLEDRLRTALREQAEDFTASPGAWERTVARARWSETAEPRRSLARGWLAGRLQARGPWLAGRLQARGPLGRLASASFAPLASAAALVAIVVAIGAVAHFAGRGGGPSSGGAPTAHGSTNAGSAALQPPGVDRTLLQQLPPGTAIVQVMQATPGQVSWSYFWFGRGARANQMCAYTVSDQLPSPSSSTGFSSGSGTGSGNGGATSFAVGASSGAEQCGSVGLPRGRFAAWVYGNQPAANVCQGLGIAAEQVVSVTAVLPGGHQIHGIVKSGRGFRYKVWVVTYPQKDAGHTTLVFRDAAGHEVDHMTGN